MHFPWNGYNDFTECLVYIQVLIFYCRNKKNQIELYINGSLFLLVVEIIWAIL